MSAKPFVAVALLRVFLGLYSLIVSGLTNAAVLIWDLGLTIFNVVVPNLPPQNVVPEGSLGARGVWPEYIPPSEGDSRSCCPALNAMANHGILPHSGRGISFRELNAKVRSTYNVAPSFCFFIPNYAANMLCRDYWTDSFDLSDLNVHNGIEHDGSLCREDTVVVSDQGKPVPKLVEELLACGTGPNGDLTPADFSRILGKRRTESKKNNPMFSLSTFHKVFGSANSSTLLMVLGGRIKDLRPFLLEERIPDGWQPCVLHPMGMTIAEFNKTTFQIELGIIEELPGSLGATSSTEQKKFA